MDNSDNGPAQEKGSASIKAPESRLPGRQSGPGKVIALLNQKSGAGKTTLATHLAGELAMTGGRVTLLDADPQGSALDWAQRRLQNGQERHFGVFGLAGDSLHQEAPQITLEVDYVVIDGPSRVAALARSALLAADLVLIPVQPSAYDVWASYEMVQLIVEARVFRPQLRAAFVISRRVVGTVIGRDARSALADQPFAALSAEISQRIVFADSVAAGRLAYEAAPRCAAARDRSTCAGGSGVAAMTTPPIAPRRRAPIGRKPANDPASACVRQADASDAPPKASVYTARLTIDVTPALRGRIKVTAFERGLTAADMLRELLEREFGARVP